MMIPNIDTLIASVDVKEYENEFGNILLLLAEKKLEAKSRMQDNTFETVQANIFGMTWEVYPNGARHHAYILHNDKYELKFANFRSKSKDTYPIYIKIKSACLWEMGYVQAWQNIISRINSVSKVTANKISRSDLCCHTDKISLVVSDIDNFVGKYRSDMLYRCDREITGFSFGTGAAKTIMCRIYNKTKEVKQKKSKLWFFDIWRKQGLNVENVWNVEFELGRKFFKQCDIETVEDMFNKVCELWQYCSNDWLRLTYGDATRNTRSEISPVWEEIQKAFCSSVSKSLVRKTVRLNRDAEKLVPSIIGYLTSYFSKKNVDRQEDKKLDIDECIEDILSRGLQYLYKVKQSTFNAEVEKKTALLLC